ncbi:pentatricopeptide repeat-containing protein At1g32415, mitochondrial [Macadamia integrifolia]|uniref:pentatricopeptide repeat-containing protein At1g32415, mitochondrial n=1 Tax=Macadamia integrifolia TaxID=60698 RepID=UPI001C4F470F|nr:pentatricopeptide repeat-containing protein At1g32415, mitochondrial [Macadamia integrifolia]
MLQTGSSHGVVSWTSMLSKFAKEGFIDEAEALFEVMPERNLVTYNAMLSAYVHSGRVADACRFFEGMPERNVVSWTSLLCGLTHCGRIAVAKKLFNVMPDKNVVTWNSMITGLIRSGDLVEARRMFDMMPIRNQVSWNVMIAGYAENCRMEEARILFDAMPDRNVVTWTTLAAGYCRAGDLHKGYYIFQRMPERNVVSWTAMIGGFAWNGFYKEALLLFLEMRTSQDMKPNEETFISLIYACSGVGFPRLGKQVHAHLILNGFDCDDYDGRLSKSLIHMYSGFGMMDFADHSFTKNSNNYTIQSYNSMINGFIRIGELRRAQYLFDTMPYRDEISWTSMITGYFSAGNVSEACCLFSKMPRRDAVTWTVMISGHIQNELFAEAIFIFSEMRVNGVTPLDSTYSSLLGAAGAMAYLDQGKQLHGMVMKTQYKLDTILENSLISMYAKCGEIDTAHHIFSDMTSRDIVTWNTMIVGFSHHGLANKALKLFEVMQDSGTCPNSVTFLGILSACSHAGMVDRGLEVFDSMSKEHSIQPGVEHYVSMIDLLGRAGKVEEAEELVLRLPFEPGLEVWGALLGICGLGKMNPAVAIRAAEQVLQLDPFNAPAHVLLCNIYASIGMQCEEGMLRKTIGKKGIRKVPGCSWIMVTGEVNIFLSGDKSHTQSDEIYSLLAGDHLRSKV